MKRSSILKMLPFAIVILALLITGIAWQTHPGNNKQTKTDTIPEKKKKIRDIDDAIEELEKSKAEVDRSIKEIEWPKINEEIRASLKDVHVDMEKIKAEVQHAIKEIDVEKIQAEVQNAIKEIDVEKVQAEVQQAIKEIDAVKMEADIKKSLKEVDVEKINAEVSKALKEVDMEKVKAEIDASIAKIDAHKINEEIDQIRNIDLKKVEENLKNLKPEIEKSISEAHAGIEKARKELIGYKNFINELDKDGLINKKSNYTIKYKKGELFINDKKQPAEVVNKYHSYLNGHKDFTIKKEKDDFDINNEDDDN